MNGRPGSLACQLPAVLGSGARSATTVRRRTASRTQTTLSSRNSWRSSTRLFASTGGRIFCSSSGAPVGIERSFSRCATWPRSPIERSRRRGKHGEKPRLASNSQRRRTRDLSTFVVHQPKLPSGPVLEVPAAEAQAAAVQRLRQRRSESIAGKGSGARSKAL